MSGTNGNGSERVEAQKREVFLSRASSRKELAATLHEIILPLLQQCDHNLGVAKLKIESLEARSAALEARLAALEPPAETV